MKLFTLLAYAAFIFTVASQANAQETPEQQIISILENQLSLLDKIEPTVERIDFSRIIVIRKSINIVLKNISENIENDLAPVGFPTMRLMQNLIIKYKFSHVFFGWEDEPSIFSIYTPMTEDELVDLKKSYELMVQLFGFDASPYTTITSNTFQQMKKLLEEIENLPINNDLKSQLRSFWPDIGRTIAVAEQGDRPCAFAMASKVVLGVREIYPELNTISNSSAAFSLVLEFQGLIEFYAEFAQIDRQPEVQTCN